jgi:hypothetical protein
LTAQYTVGPTDSRFRDRPHDGKERRKDAQAGAGGSGKAAGENLSQDDISKLFD